MAEKRGSFSERMGHKKIRDQVQAEDMDQALRNGLWNVLYPDYLRPMELGVIFGSDDWEVSDLIVRLWNDFFKRPVSELDNFRHRAYEFLEKYFNSCAWNEVYDLMEFIVNNYSDRTKNHTFQTKCNSILERELSAYRFIDGILTPISSEEEMREIEKAIELTDRFKPVATHLKRALELLSDRESPDYRNSIKESISAVEAISCLVTSNAKATLGQALKEIEQKGALHSALKQAFSSLYGYTSDAGGIRHALLDETSLDFDDAKFMLVACSAFINYLKAKAAKR